MAKMTKQSRGKTDIRSAAINGERFHMDYGFFRGPRHLQRKIKRKYGASMKVMTAEHKPIIESRKGYVAYLLIVDSKACKAWVFNTKAKEPPIITVDLFLQRNGLKDGTQRYIRTDLGGELANSEAFRELIAKHGYLIETTGPDASSQNGRSKRPHRTLANMVRCMLYSASLGAEFWADALTQAVYLYNRTYHDAIGTTPKAAWTKETPDLSHIRTFGSSVTVRKPGRRPTKSDPHCYHGIFLQFTSTKKNIVYYDINSKHTKIATHKALDEFHYGNEPESRPNMAKHMIDLAADDHIKKHKYGRPIPLQEFTHLETPTESPAAAAATSEAATDAPEDTAMIATIYEPENGFKDSDVLNIETSLDIFGPSTTETIDIDGRHPTLGFEFHSSAASARPIIKFCKTGTPAAKLHNWRSRFRHGTL
jgi:hypothetical protein